MAENPAKSRVEGARALASARVDAAQDRSATVRTLLVTYQHDRRVAGSVLAGALAYRLFGALLPLALLGAVILGWAGDSADEVAGDLGISGVAVESVSSASRLGESERWTLIVVGLGALLISSFAAVKAIRSAYAFVWEVPIVRWRNGLAGAVLLVASVLLVLAVWGVSAWARERFALAGMLVSIAAVGCFFAICLGASWLLPHRPVRWIALVPGSLLMAAGLQLMHLVTTLFLAGKVERASATYGTIGAAFALLFWMYLISRVIVGAAVLNATMAGARRDRGSSRAHGAPPG
jgi:uncharacterized BrkB/YihY/UPF0761 family membrane protein